VRPAQGLTHDSCSPRWNLAAPEERPLKLVFIYGLPATGKLTVAQELAAITGYRLFHNHLAVDLLLSAFEFGSAPFVDLREQIWLSVFDQAGRHQLPGLIFTFAPEATARPDFVSRAIGVVTGNGGDVLFIELTCPPTELKRRINSASRLQYGKLTSISLFEQLEAEGTFSPFPMPKPALSIDTSACSPQHAAVQIAQLLSANAVQSEPGPPASVPAAERTGRIP